MTNRSAIHDTFIIEHVYNAVPAKVFAAFASSEAKGHWFGPDDGDKAILQLDFRVGGMEAFTSAQPGPVYRYAAVFQDIVPDRRIVSTYNMWLDDALISVSLSTVDLLASDTGTKLTYTEQGVYLDGKDQPQFREHGTREMLVKQLSAFLASK